MRGSTAALRRGQCPALVTFPNHGYSWPAMNESEALLVVERGPVPSLRYPLQADQITVGRSAGNDLVLADPEISRRHVRVIRRADGYAVEDIGSTNGTFVNGQRISHLTLLQDGDTIDLGDTVRLRFVSLAPVVAPEDRPTEAWREPEPQEAPWRDQAEAPEPPVVAAPAQQARPTVALTPPPAAPAAAQPAPRPAAPPPAAPVHAPPAAPVYPPTYEQPRRGRGLLIGCGLLVALLLVCAGTFLVLDTYDQGRLLYCGGLRPIFQLVLGPFGFAPICP